MNKSNTNNENKKGILHHVNKLSFGALRAEMILMFGIIGICAVRAGSLFLL